MERAHALRSVLILTTAIVFASAAIAGDLPKEGTYSGTYSNPGTYKAYAVGKGRVAGSWEADGLTVGTGFLDHTIWHCFGLTDVASGLEQSHGYCVITDPAGDKILSNVASEKYAMDAKSFVISGTFTGGTGKYASIGGEIKLVSGNSSAFYTGDPGTFVLYADLKANYKLP